MHNSSTLPPPPSPSKTPSKPPSKTPAPSTQRASPVFFFCGKSPCPNSNHANPANLHCHYKDDDNKTASIGYRDDSEKASSGYRDDSEKASSGHHDDITGALNKNPDNLNRLENSNDHRASPDHHDDRNHHEIPDSAPLGHHGDQTSSLDYQENPDSASSDHHGDSEDSDDDDSADSAEKLRDFAERLPLEMSERIFGELDTESLCSAAQTCKAWHDIIDESEHHCVLLLQYVTKAWHDIIEESECLWRSQCLVIRAVCHREVDGDRGEGLSWKVTLVRNYTRGCLKRDWLRGRYSNVKSADDLIGRKMTPLDAETWGEILQAELDR